MIQVDNKIKNIYYMLCWCFNIQNTHEKTQSRVSTENFKNIYDFLSFVFIKLLSKIIKKGLYQDYNKKEAELSSLKGKINIDKTIKRNSLSKNKAVCTFNVFETNNIFNQIIKTTMDYLIRFPNIEKDIKIQLKKYLNYFDNVDFINKNDIHWKELSFNERNKYYQNIIFVCKLILKELIVSNDNGKENFLEFLDDTQISTIYENFVKEYFIKAHRIRAKSKILYFNDNPMEYMPVMKTDIFLEQENNCLIIDTKFYKQILVRKKNSSKKTLVSNNLYQILSYVDNCLKKYDKVVGMLLYAETTNDPILNNQDKLNEKTIHIRTVNLNNDWDSITQTLDDIAQKFKDGEYFQTTENTPENI